MGDTEWGPTQGQIAPQLAHSTATGVVVGNEREAYRIQYGWRNCNSDEAMCKLVTKLLYVIVQTIC